MLSIYQNKHFDLLIGLSHVQFEDLLELCKKQNDYKKFPSQVPVDIQLVIVLLYLQQYISMRFLSWIAEVDQSTVQRIIHFWIELLFGLFESSVQIPEHRESVQLSKWKVVV